MKYFALGSIVATFMILLSLPQNSWSQVEGIDGTWYMGEKSVSVEIYDHGWRFTVTNESGEKSVGKAFNEEVIYLPAENISGQIEVEGTIIEWSDGTYWSREAFTGPEPPNLPE
ncbi:MAG: hypothetical protein WBB48_09465 [Thermodesulfobacteriota bacterium]